jgi:HK97 family phage major capsid protein
MATLQELQAQHDSALARAESIIKDKEGQKRSLKMYEQAAVNEALKEARELEPKIEAAKRPTTTAEFRAKLGLPPRSMHIEPTNNGAPGEPVIPSKFSREYYDAFASWLSGTGPISAALVEGTSMSGGYAVPIVVDKNVVPLAPQDSAVRRLATVIPTKSDIRVASVTSRGTVASRSEGAAFTVAVPSLGGFTLSAFAAGVETQASIEIVQDVPLFNAFCLEDAVSAFLEYEESLFISGTGSEQAQGLIGNVGAGVTEEPDGNGNLISIQGTLDILGKLKATYHENATWLMQRATSLIIRAAQVGTDLYEPVFRRENGVDLLHGYPVAYSTQMPTAARGATPILFGDFKKSYVIGDRGGSALFVKVLDQASFAQGLINLLFFRRTDGRVRISEGIQSYRIAAS